MGKVTVAHKSYNQRNPVNRVSGRGSGGTGGSGAFDGRAIFKVESGGSEGGRGTEAGPATSGAMDGEEGKRKKLLVDIREAKPTTAKGW